MIPFDRTICACPKDVANCKSRPGYLLREDITRIGEFLAGRGEINHPEEILTLLRASKGAIVFSHDRGPFRIGTITPQLQRCPNRSSEAQSVRLARPKVEAARWYRRA